MNLFLLHTQSKPPCFPLFFWNDIMFNHIISQVLSALKARVSLCVLYLYYYEVSELFFARCNKTTDKYWLVILPLNICRNPIQFLIVTKLYILYPQNYISCTHAGISVPSALARAQNSSRRSHLALLAYPSLSFKT